MPGISRCEPSCVLFYSLSNPFIWTHLAHPRSLFSLSPLGTEERGSQSLGTRKYIGTCPKFQRFCDFFKIFSPSPPLPSGRRKQGKKEPDLSLPMGPRRIQDSFHFSSSLLHSARKDAYCSDVFWIQATARYQHLRDPGSHPLETVFAHPAARSRLFPFHHNVPNLEAPSRQLLKAAP